MKIAIITGASSGLGVEFTKAIISRYQNLDEIWIVARRKERLENTAQSYPNIKIRVIPLDLSDDTSYDELNRILIETKPDIKILINNAGLDINGRFDAMEVGDIINIININIKGMTVVNRLCFPYMMKGSFAIITGSVSSFVPVPSQAVYSSSKIYVKFLAQALREEVKEKGINVCLLCPGNMDTEMNIRSEAKVQKKKVARLPYLDMKMLTVKALQKAESGKSIYTPGAFYKSYRLLGKLFPASFMMKFTKNFFNAD